MGRSEPQPFTPYRFTVPARDEPKEPLLPRVLPPSEVPVTTEELDGAMLKAAPASTDIARKAERDKALIAGLTLSVGGAQYKHVKYPGYAGFVQVVAL